MEGGGARRWVRLVCRRSTTSMSSVKMGKKMILFLIVRGGSRIVYKNI